MNKGQSQLISTVLIVLLTVIGIGIVLTVGKPTIDRAKEVGVLNEAGQNMRVLDNLIREVVSEGSGSLRTTYLKVTDGEYRVNPDSGTLEFVFDTKSNVVQRGTFLKEGNLLTIAGGRGTSASQNSTDLILENEILKVVLNRVGSESSPASINTSQNIKSIIIKETDTALNPLDTAVIIENYTNTSYGTGYSKLVRSGDFLGKAEVLFQINSNFTGTVYQILYTLPAASDFLVVNVKNTTRNQTTMQMIHHLGSSSGDVIKIGGLNEQNYSATLSPVCYNSTQISKFYACSHDNTTEVDQLYTSALIYSGTTNNFVKTCFANYTSTDYKFNITGIGELRAILPFTKGNCNTIDNKMYLVQKQEYPSVPFNTTYAIGGDKVKVQMLLEYARIKVTGTGRIGSGTHKVCVEKIGEERLKAVVNVTVC